MIKCLAHGNPDETKQNKKKHCRPEKSAKDSDPCRSAPACLSESVAFSPRQAPLRWYQTGPKTNGRPVVVFSKPTPSTTFPHLHLNSRVSRLPSTSTLPHSLPAIPPNRRRDDRPRKGQKGLFLRHHPLRPNPPLRNLMARLPLRPLRHPRPPRSSPPPNPTTPPPKLTPVGPLHPHHLHLHPRLGMHPRRQPLRLLPPTLQLLHGPHLLGSSLLLPRLLPPHFHLRLHRHPAPRALPPPPASPALGLLHHHRRLPLPRHHRLLGHALFGDVVPDGVCRVEQRVAAHAQQRFRDI